MMPSFGHLFGPHAYLVRITVVVMLASLSIGGLPQIAFASVAGSQVWAKRYDGPGHLADSAAGVAVSPDGSTVYVTGESDGSTDHDYATIAYDASTGLKRWGKRYNGPADGNDYAHALVVSPDGTEVFVTGQSAGSTAMGYATVAYDASTGASLWTKRYAGPDDGTGSAASVAVSADGTKVFVTGADRSSATGYDYATISYSASSGAKLWAKRYNGAGDLDDQANSLSVSPDGTKVFVTGVSADATGDVDFATVAYDTSTGSESWSRVLSGPGGGYDQANSVGVSPDGTKVFVTGHSAGTTSGADYATVAYDAAVGTKLWAKRYNGPGNGADQFNRLAVSPDGTKVFVAGMSQGSASGFDYATVAYDASSGTRVWAKRYNGLGNDHDQANALGVSPDGMKVFVTGAATGSNGSTDYATVAYEASLGTRLWRARYNGPSGGSDDAFGLSVSPDGMRLFVTGASTGSVFEDYATVAYAT